MSEMLTNPFIQKSTRYSFDDETFEFTNRNLRTHFKNVYIFCKLHNDIDYQKILEGNIDYQEFKNITKMFALYKSNISLIYNQVFKQNIIIMDTELIKDSNIFGYNLPDKILVIPIFNISFLHIQNHIDNITSNVNTFEKFYNEIIIKENLKYEFTTRDIYHILKIIRNLEIDEYWTLNKNCNININKEFNSRCFNFVLSENKKSGIIASAMAKINKTEDYFNDLLEKKIDKMVVNEDSTFNNKYFYSKEGSGYTNEEINSIIKFFTDKLNKIITQSEKNNSLINLMVTLIYTLFNKLFKSRDFCHHILNNIEIIKLFNSELFSSFLNSDYLKIDFINNFKYAWTRFYLEEKAKEGYLNTNDEIVFDIHTANSLPFFAPKTREKFNNPYICIPISAKAIHKNIYGVDYSSYVKSDKANNKDNYLGINNLTDFKSNMNTFISGSDVFNIFDGINFKEKKMAVTGSIMPACLQKNNPLKLKFENNYRYYSEYYCNSDVDVMIKTNDVNEFLNISQEIFKQMKENIKTYFEYLFIDIEYNKNIYVYITKNFIENNLSNFDYKYVKENINSDEIIENILPYIIEEHQKYLDSLNINENQLKFIKDFDKSKVNVILYEENKENYDDITIRFNVKAKVKSKYLSRELEIFMISGNDFMNVVSKFHLPCVRAYYDGDNVYMTPSCITSYMTMINMHYTYFSSNTTPMEIINKYRMRGFGIILNKKEISQLFQYSCNTEFWRNLYGFHIIGSLNGKLKKFLSDIPINNSFYEPRKTNYAFYLDNDYVEDIYNTRNLRDNNRFIIEFYGNVSCLDEYKIDSYNNGNLKAMKNFNLNDNIEDVLKSYNNKGEPLVDYDELQSPITNESSNIINSNINPLPQNEILTPIDDWSIPNNDWN